MGREEVTEQTAKTPEQEARERFQPGKNVIGVLLRCPYDEHTPEYDRFFAEWAKIEQEQS